MELAIARMDSGIENLIGLNLSRLNNRKTKRQKTFCPLQSKSILIVDDSLDNLEIIKMFLDSYGGHADIASDGKEALQMMSLQKYDVVLMDIEMPKMNPIFRRSEHRLIYLKPVFAIRSLDPAILT